MEKSNDDKLLEMFHEVSELEKRLNEMSREELISLLITRFLGEFAPFEPDKKEIDLWYYMDAETGTKYISNEFPKAFLTSSSKYPVFLSEGEINIRVPNMMESMFPEIQKDEPPTKVHLTVSF